MSMLPREYDTEVTTQDISICINRESVLITPMHKESLYVSDSKQPKELKQIISKFERKALELQMEFIEECMDCEEIKKLTPDDEEVDIPDWIVTGDYENSNTVKY